MRPVAMDQGRPTHRAAGLCGTGLAGSYFYWKFA